jgi:hypothetical protein
MSDHENHDAADVESARGRAESNADASDRENVRRILPLFTMLFWSHDLFTCIQILPQALLMMIYSVGHI